MNGIIPPLPPLNPFDALLKAAKEVIKGFGSIFSTKENNENEKGIFDLLLDAVKSKLEQGKELLSAEVLRIAMCYEEHNFESLSFEELLNLIRKSYALKPGIRICVLKQEAKQEYGLTTLEIAALDDKDQIQTSASSPWCHIVVAKLEPTLLQAFNGKSMLMLQ